MIEYDDSIISTNEEHKVIHFLSPGFKLGSLYAPR